MFKKLVKYEFQSVGKWYFGIYAGTLALATVLAFWVQAISSRSDQPEIAEGIFVGSAFMIFGILVAALFLSTFLMIINRFRKNVYGRQGYLTMTLPVNEHQIILSKLFASLVWYLLSGITAVLSIGIVITVLLINTGEVLPDLQVVLEQINVASLASYLIDSFIGAITWILLIYFSVSVGQLFKDHRLLFAIITYIGITVVVGILTNLLYLNNLEGMFGSPLSLYPNPVMVLINIILAFAYYFGTHYIMTKKLNLQ
ncbi:ABC transporter permease [Streptococcus sp. P25B114]|uniref:ABC transporter permease n=1 Tax=unclassified Streptococcus TaxID=2608887 RepID=UPI00374D5F55